MLIDINTIDLLVMKLIIWKEVGVNTIDSTAAYYLPKPSSSQWPVDTVDLGFLDF